MNRISIKERTALLRARPPIRTLDLRPVSVSAPKIDDNGRLTDAFVSLAGRPAVVADPELVDALDVNGAFRWPRRATGGTSVTAALMGDPTPGRSALDERMGIR